MQKRLANFQGGKEDMKVSGSVADSGFVCSEMVKQFLGDS